MKRFRFLVCLTLIAALASSCVHFGGVGQKGPVVTRVLEKGELVVGTTGGMPPLNMTTKDGEVIGLEIDLANILAGAMKVNLRIETMPFAELLPALQAGKVDIILSGMTMTPDRNLTVAFSGPYYESGKACLTKKRNLATAKTPDLNSPNVRIAALEGSTSQYFVEEVIPQAKLVPTKDYDTAIKMVLDDRVDAMIADYPICVTALFRNPGKDLISIFTTLSYEPIGIAMPLGDPHLVNWMDNALDAIEGVGKLDELKDHWFKDPSWLNRLP